MPRQNLQSVPLVVGAGGVNQYEPEATEGEVLDARNWHSRRGYWEKRLGSVPYTTGVTELRPQRYFRGYIGAGDSARRAASDSSTTTTITDADASFNIGELVGMGLFMGASSARITANTYEATNGYHVITFTPAINPAPTGLYEVYARVAARVNTGSSGTGTALTNRAGTLGAAQELYIADDVRFDGIQVELTATGPPATPIYIRDVSYSVGSTWTVLADASTGSGRIRDTTQAVATSGNLRHTMRQTGRISWHRPSGTTWTAGDPLGLGGGESRYWIRIRFGTAPGASTNTALGSTQTTINAPGLQTVVRQPLTGLWDFQTQTGRRWLLGAADDPDVRNIRKGGQLGASQHNLSDMDQLHIEADFGGGIYGVYAMPNWSPVGGTTNLGTAGVLTKSDQSYNWAGPDDGGAQSAVNPGQFDNGWFANLYDMDGPFAKRLLITKTTKNTLTFQGAAPGIGWPAPGAGGGQNFTVGRPLYSGVQGAGQWRWSFAYNVITDKLLATNGRGPVLELDGNAATGIIVRLLLADGPGTSGGRTGNPSDSAFAYLGVRAVIDDRPYAYDSLRSEPPQGRFLLSYLKRIVVLAANGRPNTVAWSAPGVYNNVWLQVDEEELRDADNSPITGGAVLDDALYVFKRDVIWRAMPSGDRLAFARASERCGAVANGTIQTVTAEGASQLLFAGEDGIYRFSGSEPVYISRKIEDLYRRGLNQGRLWAASATVWKQRNWYMLACSSAGSNVNDLIIVYDFAKQAFWVLSFPWGAESILAAETASDREVLLVGTADGYVMQFDAGDVTDDGRSVASYLQTKPLLSPQVRAMSFRHLYIQGLDRGTGPLSVEVYRDAQRSATPLPSGGSNPVAVFNLSRSTWNGQTWANTVWDAAEERKVRVDLPVVVGERMGIILRDNTTNMPTRLRGVTAEVFPRGKR